MAERKPSLASTVLIVAGTVAAHVGLWMAFVFKPSGPEWTLGTIGACVAALVTIAFARCTGARFHVKAGMVAQAWRIPWGVISDSGRVAEALGKQLFTRGGAESYLAAVPYDACSDDPHDKAKRAMETLYSTCTPNSVVLGVTKEQGLLLFHQVKKSPLSQMMENLGAHPVHAGEEGA